MSANDERLKRYEWESQDSLEVKDIGKGKVIDLEELAAERRRKAEEERRRR